jgi:hypothetical protein
MISYWIILGILPKAEVSYLPSAGALCFPCDIFFLNQSKTLQSLLNQVLNLLFFQKFSGHQSGRSKGASSSLSSSNSSCAFTSAGSR